MSDEIFINRFVIIWIPVVLLLIFNTILISYVRRSKENKQQHGEGVELRRHNRGNQSEQRKTTIMLSRSFEQSIRHLSSSSSSSVLVAVVLVFCVCQIPQAIALTLSSFFPVLARTPKVLIYNNIANLLVAINASINFLLYCCFSERFRSTFRANFAFLSKYCAHYIQPEWKPTASNNHHHQHHHHQGRHSTSIDNVSNHSQQATPRPGHVRHSNASVDIHGKHERVHHLTLSTKLTPSNSEQSPTIEDEPKQFKCHSSRLLLE